MAGSTEIIRNKVSNATSIEELREVIKNLPKDSFCVRIDQMREKHGIKSFGSIQKDVAMGKTNFFDVLSGQAHPKKQHVIKIGLAMGLSVEEINELLKLAGHKELYPKNAEDAVVMFGVQKRMSIIDIETELENINASFSLFEK